MANVKIFLNKGETLEEAEDLLFKSLNLHNSGEVHDEQTFDDPAMDHVCIRLQQEHKRIYQDLLNEIFMVLDQDYIK